MKSVRRYVLRIVGLAALTLAATLTAVALGAGPAAADFGGFGGGSSGGGGASGSW